MTITKKKLIEVALPLEAINKAAAREKSIRHGHPSTLHLWWARRPLAAARAVIFAQMVDDPSANPDLFKTEKAQEKERQRLFKIIEDLVKWENTTNEEVLQKAREEIWQSWRRACAQNADHPRAKELFDRTKLPAFHDPFAGGGALPLEAQRLGLEAYASDLNPVAVLINKAMIEIPPKFAGKPPINPKAREEAKNGQLRNWKGAEGLAEDVRYYGQWMRDEAEKRIGHLYPKVEVTAEMANDRPDIRPYVGKKMTVIAWLWARTVKSPNPAFANVDVPLVSTFMLSLKAGKEVYIEPVVDGQDYQFHVKIGVPPIVEAAKVGTKMSSGSNFRCLVSNTLIEASYIRSEAQARRMNARLLAVVVNGTRGRVYLAPTSEMEAIAVSAKPSWKPDLVVPTPCHDVDRLPMYGMPTWGDAFTARQLVGLGTLSDLVTEAHQSVYAHAKRSDCADDYADAIGLYLALAVDKAADYNSSFSGWIPAGETLRSTFGRQAISMSWDFCEANILGSATGSFDSGVSQIASALGAMPMKPTPGHAFQHDAQTVDVKERVVSVDPPYYDNISYADVSDFFYVWLRNSLKTIVPSLLSTLAVPKSEELVATPYRHGNKKNAEEFFLNGMTAAMHRLAEQSHANYPVTIYYAFKQAETEDLSGTASTGWETFLDAVIQAGFSITGTWPMRTERGSRSIGIGTNALASSIILVCRQRFSNATTATRREFLTALKAELPDALAHLQAGNIAPVDLAQAAIGPGMAVFTRYAKVLDSATGKDMTVREALASINQVLDEALAEQEGDFDSDTRWALSWFEQYGFSEGEYGVAETLAKAKNIAIGALADDGILESKRGKVRLFKPAELPADWDPATDKRLTTWEMVHHLIRLLEAGGESAAAVLVAKLGSKAEVARELAYRLYVIADRKKRAGEALSYNGLVQSWPEIQRLASEVRIETAPAQGELI